MREINELAKTINPFWELIKPFYGPRDFGEGYELSRTMGNWDRRNELCRLYTWAVVPDPASISFVAEHLGDRAIEIGAGTGYWAWQLTQLRLIEQIKGSRRGDFDILCYDESPPDREKNRYHGVPDDRGNHKDLLAKTWFDVAKGGPEILKKHNDRTLFLCWPPYATSMAAECLQHYQGHCLVFIGESQGGCTGDDAFFERLEAEWNGVETHDIVQWWGIHDTITVYERMRTIQ
jgi:hypothetical protein